MTTLKEAAKKGGIGATIVGGATACTSAALSAIGFTSGGVAAGSAAAGIQAGIGNVVVGSAFAGLQSLGATGVLLTVGLPVAIGVGFVGGIGYYFYVKPRPSL